MTFGFSTDVENMFKIIYSILVFFTVFFYGWKLLKPNPKLKELIDRTLSWWVMISIIFFSLGFGADVAIWMLALLAFIALREFFSSIPLSFSDRRAIFWCYLAIPVQFYAISINYYRFFIIWIPILMFMILAMRRIAIADTDNIMRSLGIINFSNILVTFSLGHVAYLLVLEYPSDFQAGGVGLVIYLLFLTQFNDVLQFIWGKLLGKRKIIPKVSPNKTWEGFIGGLLSTTALAYVFKFLTPFTTSQALTAGFLIAFLGFFGDLNISAIKRDIGVKDMGSSIPGHGGVMDRLDSLSFSAFIFFHIVHLWVTP